MKETLAGTISITAVTVAPGSFAVMPLSPEPSGRRPDYDGSRPLSPLEEDVPPPFYSDKYGQMDIHHIGFGTNARVVGM